MESGSHPARRPTPPAGWRGARLSDDETVAKMGHPDLARPRVPLRTPRSKSIALTILALVVFSVARLPAASEEVWELGPFTRPEGVNPVIQPDAASLFHDPFREAPVHWEALHTFNPAAIVRNGKIYMFYRAEDDTGKMEIGGHTSRLGLATSSDGLHFTRGREPVFYPARDSQAEREWPGGVEDPRIVEAEDGRYVLTYTQYNGQTYDVGIATSKDLLHWTKFGPAFQGSFGGKFDGLRYKSAGIVTTIKGSRLIAAKIHGRFWMYWGEGKIHLATSEDLIHWLPLLDVHGNPVVVLTKRPGHFDSGFPEVGPPPILTPAGLVLIYNGKNATDGGDKLLQPGTYSAGQALYSTDDPLKQISRLDKPFLRPEKPFERTGQYAAGTTFAEGLVLFKGKWMLYYGCADSLVGVVTSPAHLHSTP